MFFNFLELPNSILPALRESSVLKAAWLGKVPYVRIAHRARPMGWQALSIPNSGHNAQVRGGTFSEFETPPTQEADSMSVAKNLSPHMQKTGSLVPRHPGTWTSLRMALR